MRSYMRPYKYDYDPQKLRNEILRDYYWASVHGTGEHHKKALDALMSWLLFYGVEVVVMPERGDGSETLLDIASGKRLPFYALYPDMIFEGLRGLRPDLFDMMDDLS